MDNSSIYYRYYRNAVEQHWDPLEIDISKDKEGVKKLFEDDFYNGNGRNVLLKTLGMFGAGEEAVAEDLAPMVVGHNNMENQMFLTTQMYEEAKHADFFNYYWNNVINEVEEEMGIKISDPQDDKWLNSDYNELFNRNQKEVYKLINDFSPKQQVIAHSHYHLVIEGVLAQTGYWGITESFASENEVPNLPGLVEGINKIRRDEGRHVGYGMKRIKHHLHNNDVNVEVLNSTLKEILPLVQGVVNGIIEEVDDMEEYPVMNPEELITYSMNKHQQRMKHLLNEENKIPEVEELVELD